MSRPRDGRYDPNLLGGGGASIGDALVWDGIRWKPGPVASAVLWVDVAANPPTDGSVFWYVTDESC
jgi:hypothetical protein